MAPAPAQLAITHTASPKAATNMPSSTTSTDVPSSSGDAMSLDAPEQPPPKKRKKKDTHILHISTFRKPLWAYFHLQLIVPALLPITPHTTAPNTTDLSNPSPTPASPDTLTISTLLMPALKSFLGLTGTSIPVDILSTHGLAVYIRIPRQDRRAVRAALAGWTGGCDAELIPGASGLGDNWGKVRVAWRVVGEGESLGMLGGEGVGGDGLDLFGG